MSNERDELADIIASNRNEYADKTADRILAAGYRKPKPVTTLAEVDALPLPLEYVIRDSSGHVLDRWSETDEDL